jgi:4-aminobutyrate aminotransferase/(S)-3-amino-2-methylpropionate transaminase
LLERSRAVGDTIGGRLDAMAKRFDAVGDVRGRGAMRAIELVADRETKEPANAETMGAISRGALQRGVIVLTAGTYGNVLRLLPPVTIEYALLGEGLDLLEESVAEAVG